MVSPTYPVTTGQLDLISFSGGTSPTGSIDFDYFPPTSTTSPGKLQSITGPYGSTRLSFEYDGALRTKESYRGTIPSQPSWATISWGYNNEFRRSHETVTPGGATSYFGYDADGLLTCVSATGSSVDTPLESATCDPLAATDLRLGRSSDHGMVTEIAAGNVTEHIYYSDSADDGPNHAFGELRHQEVMYGSTPLAEFSYDDSGSPRDDVGRVRVKTETFGANSIDLAYGYDERGRLESVEAGARSESFTYDTNGNRTSYSGPGGAVASTNISYDDQDRLNTYGSVSFTYGKNGELRTKAVGSSTTTYTYDARGNLTKVQRTNLSDINYMVDGMGRRIGKMVASPAFNKRWIYRDGLRPVAEIDGPGTIVARYIYGSRTNVPDLVIKGSKTYRLIVDQLGSPRMAINIADITDVPYRVDYSAFGVPTWKGSGAVAFDWIPFGFAGGIYDADTGLVRFGARDYDPTVGRWVSKDPARFDGGQANLYVYAGNDPVNARDPSGQIPIISNLMCAYEIWKLGDAYDDCHKELKDKLDRSTCIEDDAEALNGAGSFSDAEMQCVMRRDPGRWTSALDWCGDQANQSMAAAGGGIWKLLRRGVGR